MKSEKISLFPLMINNRKNCLRFENARCRNFGPVSRLLRRCHHATSHLTTKSCDNIYSIHRNSNSLDWIIKRPSNNEKGNAIIFEMFRLVLQINTQKIVFQLFPKFVKAKVLTGELDSP